MAHIYKQYCGLNDLPFNDPSIHSYGLLILTVIEANKSSII